MILCSREVLDDDSQGNRVFSVLWDDPLRSRLPFWSRRLRLTLYSARLLRGNWDTIDDVTSMVFSFKLDRQSNWKAQKYCNKSCNKSCNRRCNTRTTWVKVKVRGYHGQSCISNFNLTSQPALCLVTCLTCCCSCPSGKQVLRLVSKGTSFMIKVNEDGIKSEKTTVITQFMTRNARMTSHWSSYWSSYWRGVTQRQKSVLKFALYFTTHDASKYARIDEGSCLRQPWLCTS